jgi:hypothetical protein
MVPEASPDDGVQPEPQFVPPQVRAAAFHVLYLPAAQSAHVEASAAENLPSSQMVQTVEAAAAEYLPARHDVHVEAAIAPTTADPAGHVRHAEAPTSPEYVPVAQSVHVEDPAAHTDTHKTMGFYTSPHRGCQLAM